MRSNHCNHSATCTLHSNHHSNRSAICKIKWRVCGATLRLISSTNLWNLPMAVVDVDDNKGSHHNRRSCKICRIMFYHQISTFQSIVPPMLMIALIAKFYSALEYWANKVSPSANLITNVSFVFAPGVVWGAALLQYLPNLFIRLAAPYMSTSPTANN